jgi:hypothetical protein
MVFLSIELALIAPQLRDSIKTKRQCDGKTAGFRFQPFRSQLLAGASAGEIEGGGQWQISPSVEKNE